MPKQVGYIKGPGTVDGNLSFYSSEGEYRARLKPGVNKHRFHTDPVFEGARRTSGFFGRAGTLASLIYRYVYTNRRCNKLYNLFMIKAIALKEPNFKGKQIKHTTFFVYRCWFKYCIPFIIKAY